MRKFLNLIISKEFWLNILGILFFFAIVIVILMICLRNCTHHGETLTVPTVVGMTADEAIALIDDEGFKYAVVDTVFVDSLPKGIVVEQFPAKESLVKRGRTVYIKVNTFDDIYIEMPDFIGSQSRTLKVALKNYKLKLGNISYQKDDDVKNIVLKQMYNGRSVAPGTKIKQGSTIDFVVAGHDPNVIEEEEEDSTSNVDSVGEPADDEGDADDYDFDE